MCGNVYFNPTSACSQWFISIPIRLPRFSPVLFLFPSQSHRLFSFPPAASPIKLLVSHLNCCCFSLTSWNKLPVYSRRSLLVSKNKWKLKYKISILGQFSQCRSFSLLGGKREDVVLSFLPIPTPSHSRALFHYRGTRLVLPKVPILKRFPWDQQDSREFSI